MEKDDSDQSDRVSPSNPIKFIIMDSQIESEDPDSTDLPALRSPKARARKESKRLKKNLADTDSDYNPSKTNEKDVCVFVSDSEYDVHSKSRASNSSSESIVVGESEDQMEVTVIERKERDKISKSMEKEDDNKSDSGSSFRSNSRQTLGKYNTAEMSHSQGAKVRGHLFPDESMETSEVDLFPEDMISTPADHIGSLQLSAQPMLVPETADEEFFALSPSQDNFPHVIPDSPTSEKDEASYDPTTEQTLSEQKTDFNTTVVRNTSQKDVQKTETQESFHLRCSLTEAEELGKQITEKVSVEKSQDVIVISQDEEQEENFGESQEFALRLSPSQLTQKESKSSDSKSLSDGNESFHLKLPREVEPEEGSGSQGHKILSQPDEKPLQTSQSMQRSSQGQPVDDENMITQTPLDTLRDKQSLDVPPSHISDTGRMPLKPTPSLTIEMITIESQVSEHSFNLDRPDVLAIESEQSPSQDSRGEVFRKIKSSDKSASRYVIHDDSDEEVSFKSSSKIEQEKLSNDEKEDSRTKLRSSRTISSELTSTGYQASAESLMSSVLPEDTSNIQKDTSSNQAVTSAQKGDKFVNEGDATERTDSIIDIDQTQSYDSDSYLRNINKLDKTENQQSHSNTKDNLTCGKDETTGEIETSVLQPVETVTDNSKISKSTSDSCETKTKEKTNEENVDQTSKQVIIKPVKQFHEIDRNIRNIKSKQTCKDQAESLQSGAQNDPYEFHGSQSQILDEGAEINPMKYYMKRKVPSRPIDTLPSSRKRKRMVHKKTGLKAALKTKASNKSPGDKHHVCFSSPVTESLTTSPSQNKHTQITPSSSKNNPKKELRTEVTPLRNIPTRAEQQMLATFSPPRDRIEEDFPNITTQVTLHRQPIVSSQVQVTLHRQPIHVVSSQVQATLTTTTTEMRPPTSVPPMVKSPSTFTLVSAVNTITTPSAGSSTMLTRTDNLPQQQTHSQKDTRQTGQSTGTAIKLKTVTTTIVSYKTVETVEKVILENGTVQILSQYMEKFPRPVQTKTYTETTEEDYVDSPISPSRTNSTVTSGDLGDISSSLSRSSSSGPSSLEAHRLGSEVVVSQSSENTCTLKTRKSLDIGPIGASPRDIHRVSESETYSPLDVSSIHKTSDRRISSENLFTSPDTSKGEEEVKKAVESSGLSDAITCAQRKVVEPVQRSEESEPLFILPKPATTGSSDSSNLSPEIPNQDTAISTTKPDKLEDKTDSVKATAELKDIRIMAKWKDTHFYPGVIKEVMGKSRYRVQFDDGDILIIKGCDILLIEKLPVGQSVMVLSKDGYFYPGIITAESKKGEIIQYTVNQYNGKSGKFRYSHVILSEDQAASMIAHSHCQLSEPSADSEDVTVKNPDVSLENLVVGKRRKESRYEQQNISVVLEEEEEKPGPSSSKKRRRNVTGPATSTPRVTKRRKISEDVNPESTPTSAITSPIAHRRSPRKGSSTSKPPKLFQGMYFMLTHVDRTPEAIAIEKEILRGSSLETSADESCHDDEDHIPFDKDFLKKKIKSEGGVILDKIDKHSKLKSPLFLISDAYHRTVKYFQSLAAGLPCISHLWIRDSIHHHTVLDYKSYILQAGISFQKKKVVEWNARRGDLAMMTIMVESEKEKMTEEWSNILEIADATVVNKLHSKRDTDGVVQVLVTDSSCKAQVLRSAKSLNVPIVSTEWIIQCLINGQVMDFTGHPRYQYDFAVI